MDNNLKIFAKGIKNFRALRQTICKSTINDSGLLKMSALAAIISEKINISEDSSRNAVAVFLGFNSWGEAADLCVAAQSADVKSEDGETILSDQAPAIGIRALSMSKRLEVQADINLIDGLPSKGLSNRHIRLLKIEAKRIKNKHGIPHCASLELVSIVHGFKNWNNVLRFVKQRSNLR